MSVEARIALVVLFAAVVVLALIVTTLVGMKQKQKIQDALDRAHQDTLRARENRDY